MLNFFTKLLTPVFVALGMVNPTPVVETPVPDILVQQELTEFRQNVQEIESQNDSEIEAENQEIKVVEKIVETRPVETKEDMIEVEVTPVFQPIVNKEPEMALAEKIIEEAEPAEVDIAYQEKLVRFYNRVESMNESHDERIADSSEYKKILNLKQEIKDLSKKYDDILYAQSIGLIYGSTTIDNSGRGIPSSIIVAQQADSNSAQELENRNFLYSYDSLKNSLLIEISELEEDLTKIEQRHINEIKELQGDWNIKTEDKIY